MLFLHILWGLWILCHMFVCNCTANRYCHSQYGKENRDQKSVLYLWDHQIWILNYCFRAPYLCASLHPGDVPVDTELLAKRQWRIIVSYRHQVGAATLTFLPVNQLIFGNRIPIGIKGHIITILGKIYFLKLCKNLWQWHKTRQWQS